MLGVGKAAPAQFILRGKTNLRRISAAGQKAGFAAYPSHWAAIWWDVIGGQCIFFVNIVQSRQNLRVTTVETVEKACHCEEAQRADVAIRS